MQQQQITLSPDLKKLRDEGFEIEVREGHLIVHHVPYVNCNCEVKFGKLISTLSLNNDVTITPDTHVIYFMGDYPCNRDGSIITAIKHSDPNNTLFEDIVLNYSFSNKPPNGYANYYEKVVSYVEIISSQAKSIDKSVTAKTFKLTSCLEEDSVFNYIDTNSSRANINNINSKFKGQKIGIIGLGGTGSYVLDLVAKTPVDEILLFDSDVFLQHNAFRSPGAPSLELLDKQQTKVNYLASIYSNMHKRIKAYPEKITEDNIHLVKDLSFVFICIDSNFARGMIISSLIDYRIPFIDVGLGVDIADNSLMGILRVTVGTPDKYDHIPYRIGTEDELDNVYSTNIQIADLNALNAVMAIIKWKKMCGFYKDFKNEHHSTYTINTSQLINDDFTT